MRDAVAQIVAAYLANNKVAVSELPNLIAMVRAAMGEGSTSETVNVAPSSTAPAVAIDQSLQREFIVCLECGKTHKTLTRHLKASHGLTPPVYRAKWQLPKDYPMSCTDYTETRQLYAQVNGLGK